MNHFKSLVIAVVSCLSVNAFCSQPQCDTDRVVGVTCIREFAGAGIGQEIRFTTREFQTCHNSRITALERVNDAQLGPEFIDGVSTQISSHRTYFADRGDNLTLQMPVSATFSSGGVTYSLSMGATGQRYDSSPDDFWVGSFSGRNAQGQVVDSGRLLCTLQDL